VRPRSQFLYVHVSVSDLYTSRIGPPPPIWLEQFGAIYADRTWEYINRSKIHECGKWETEHDNSVLEIMRPVVYFLGIHKSEPDIILDSHHRSFICGVILKEVLLSGIQHEHNSTTDMPNK
jgi:hypothetical protein